MLTMKSTADKWAAFRAGFRSSRNLYPFSVSPFSRSGGVMDPLLIQTPRQPPRW
jgi:hypothetical protein